MYTCLYKYMYMQSIYKYKQYQHYLPCLFLYKNLNIAGKIIEENSNVYLDNNVEIYFFL